MSKRTHLLYEPIRSPRPPNGGPRGLAPFLLLPAARTDFQWQPHEVRLNRGV
jgi:hypothetical protein